MCFKLLIIVDRSATYRPDTCRRGIEEKEESIVLLLAFKVYVLTVTGTKR